MEIHDFLKVKQVRCVNDDYEELTIGRTYELLGVSEVCVKAIGNDGAEHWFLMRTFEPVLDSAENPLENIELTPEFEAAEPVSVDNRVNIQGVGTDILDTNADIKDKPKFEVGDRVYCAGFSVLFKVLRVENTNGVLLEHCAFEGGMYADAKHVCHATQENYERLQATFTEIEFEQPPKPLTGSDLCRAMVDKGWFIVDCYVSPISDEHALRVKAKRMQVTLFVDDLFTDGALRFRFAVPFDPRTGEPLTAKQVGL